MVGDFSFSDSGAQLALANAEYWWASASFNSHFRSCILSSFIFTITSKFLALRVSGLDFLKVKSQAGVLKKKLKSRSQTLKPGNRSLPKSQSYHSIHLLFPLPHLIHIALIVYNIIYYNFFHAN